MAITVTNAKSVSYDVLHYMRKPVALAHLGRTRVELRPHRPLGIEHDFELCFPGGPNDAQMPEMQLPGEDRSGG